MKICCVFNYNPLYRLPIYSAMDKELDCDFFFGDTVFQPLKQFDPYELKGFKGYIKARKFRSYIWHSGISKIFKKQYSHFILTGQNYLLINWLILIYAYIFNKKVYLWCHGVKTNNIKWFTTLKLKIFYKCATGILMYNHYNCKYMEALGIHHSKLHVIHNSLDTKLQTSHYSCLSPSSIYKQHFNNNFPTLIYIGRIQKVKRTDLILDAMHLLRQEGCYVNLIVVGEKVGEVLFESKVVEYGLQDHIWIYGPCYDEKKNSEFIYNADVCISPGNVGLTCIHVLSYGTPVITNNNFSTQMPEFEAIDEGKTGGYFEEDNVQELVEQIKYWTTITPRQREECRITARQTILKEWSVDFQINLLKSLLS